MFQKLKSMFRKNHTVTIYLKSGDRIVTKAYKFKVTKNGNELTGMSYELAGNKSLYCTGTVAISG